MLELKLNAQIPGLSLLWGHPRLCVFPHTSTLPTSHTVYTTRASTPHSSHIHTAPLPPPHHVTHPPVHHPTFITAPLRPQTCCLWSECTNGIARWQDFLYKGQGGRKVEQFTNLTLSWPRCQLMVSVYGVVILSHEVIYRGVTTVWSSWANFCTAIHTLVLSVISGNRNVQWLPYSSKFSWHIFVNFVIDPSFTNFLFTKI